MDSVPKKNHFFNQRKNENRYKRVKLNDPQPRNGVQFLSVQYFAIYNLSKW